MGLLNLDGLLGAIISRFWVCGRRLRARRIGVRDLGWPTAYSFSPLGIGMANDMTMAAEGSIALVYALFRI